MKQLSGFHYRRNVTFKFTRIEPSGFHLGKCQKSITGTVQNRRCRRTQAHAYDRQSCKRVLKRLNVCVVNKGGHFYTIHSNCSVVLLYYFSLKGVRCCTIAWTFSSTPKSIGGSITIMPITLKLRTLITR